MPEPAAAAAFRLEIQARGLDEAAAALEGFPERLRAALLRAGDRASLAVEARAKELVSGEVLQARTGTLRRSIEARAPEAIQDGVRCVVGVGAKYGRIHELGGEIRPKAGRVGRHGRPAMLRFTIGDRVLYRRHVTIPERSYMRRGLKESAAQIQAEIRQAVREAAGRPSTGSGAAAAAA